MRDPLNHEPAPYTEAAILFSPTPAWKQSARWHVAEWFYARTDRDDESVALLLNHARRSVLYGGSITGRRAGRVGQITSEKELLAAALRPEGKRWRALYRSHLSDVHSCSERKRRAA